MRLPPPFGLSIDRTRVLSFEFEGREYTGYQGDTIASALIANGVWIIGRSFKYHRPRSLLSLDSLDANLLVAVNSEPNQPAESTPLADGMSVTAQNYFGSLRRDLGVFIGLLSRFLPVGFYYRAFYRPRGIWNYWEKLIRALAGLGQIDRDHYWRRRPKKYDWTDVAVIGAGSEGCYAAKAAAEAGADVLLLDAKSVVCSTELDGVRIRQNCTVHGVYADGWIGASQSGILHKIRATQIIIATGRMQQPVIFRNNDRPGIMLGESAIRLAREFGVLAGKIAVVITNGHEGYKVAETLLEAGAEQVTVVDHYIDGPTINSLKRENIKVLGGYEPVEARGFSHVTGIIVQPIDNPVGKKNLDCDLVCMCGGYVPDAALWCHTGGVLQYDQTNGRWRLGGEPPNMIATGSVTGSVNADTRDSGAIYAGRLAAFYAGFGERPSDPAIERDENKKIEPIIIPHPRGREFIDFDEDLTVGDLEGAIAQGFDHPQLLKRYSTLGMGPSQGRHALLAGIKIIGKNGQDASGSISTTTFRPPLFGISFASLAGESFHPERLTPMDRWHRDAGAKMMVAGTWWRPAYYVDSSKNGIRTSVLEEARQVRNQVGLIDVSTLGKIEIRGPDAPTFMERFYTFRFAKQQVGRLRYALATDMGGSIIDDGVACRMAEDHYYVTTTTGASDQIYRSMLWWNLYWRLKVDITNVTGAWCAVNIAGPLSRRVLSRLTDYDISSENVPYQAARECVVCGVPVRIFRVGFVGELGYEVHTPSGYGQHLWGSLMTAGKPESIRPFGVEAQRTLRLEKGHIIVGQDTDSLTYPKEAGMDWAVADKKTFVGNRSIEVLNKRTLGRVLAGFRVADGISLPREGNLTFDGGTVTGRVTSSGLDTKTGSPIGLAYISPDQAASGSSFEIKLSSGPRIKATVAQLPFYDPENKRQEINE